jgi:hypothetical protein
MFRVVFLRMQLPRPGFSLPRSNGVRWRAGGGTGVPILGREAGFRPRLPARAPPG